MANGITFGRRLSVARKTLKLPVSRVAEKLGVSVNTIYAWESDSSKPRDAKVLKKIYDFLGVTLEEEKPAPKASARKKLAPMSAFSTPPGTTHMIVVGEGGGGGGGPSPVAQFARLLGFFMTDQARRSTLTELLTFCEKHKVTLHDLQKALEGAG